MPWKCYWIDGSYINDTWPLKHHHMLSASSQQLFLAKRIMQLQIEMVRREHPKARANAEENQ